MSQVFTILASTIYCNDNWESSENFGAVAAVERQIQVVCVVVHGTTSAFYVVAKGNSFIFTRNM